MKISKIIDIANKGYAYLVYKKIKNNSDSLENFIKKVGKLNTRRYMKNLIYENYPIKDCSSVEQELLFKENIEMIKKMPSEFFDDHLNILKIVNIGNNLDYIEFLPEKVINNKEFIVALLFKNKDAFLNILKYLNTEILNDVEFLSYLTTFSNRIALSVIGFKKDVKFNERFIEQLLKDNHEQFSLYQIKQNLLYEMISIADSNIKKLDSYIIKETLDLFNRFPVSHVTHYSREIYPLLDYVDIFAEVDSKFLKEFKKEIVDNYEKYFEENFKYFNLNNSNKHKKVYVVNDEYGESLMNEAIKRNPLLFIFFSSEKLINKDNIELIKIQKNKDLKVILGQHMISIILSNSDYLKKYGKEMEYLFRSEFIEELKEEQRYDLSHRNVESSYYDWIMNLRASDVPTGLTVDTYALTLFKFYQKEFLTFRFNDDKKKLKSNWKNIFEHLDKEFNGNVEVFKTFLSKHPYIPDIVTLEIIKSMDNKPGCEKFLREIINNIEKEGGLLNNELFMKYSDMNIENLSRDEKIERISNLEKGITVAKVLLKNQDFFKSLRPDNKKELDIIFKAFNSFNNDDLELLDKSFYKNSNFISFLMENSFSIELLKSKKFKENIDKSFYEKEDNFKSMLKKFYYLHSIISVYGEHINNFRNFNFWKEYFKESCLYLSESKEDKKKVYDYFNFLTEENKVEILKKVVTNNYFLMTYFYEMKIIDDDFIIKNLKSILENKNITSNFLSFMGENRLNEDIKKNLFLEILEINGAKNEKMSDSVLSLMLKIYPLSLKEDKDIMFKFLNIINDNYKGTFNNVETNLFQSFMNNEKFKESFESVYGKVSVLEVLNEDTLFFDKIITKWEEGYMLQDLNKKGKLEQVKVKNIKKF